MTSKFEDKSLWTVTSTGADDWTDPNDLVELSQRYPFVEWGILWSLRKAGHPRYPTSAWMRDLGAKIRTHNLRVSLHLCGELAHVAMDNEIKNVLLGCQRVQINGFEPALSTSFEGWPSIESILQCSEESSLNTFAEFIRQRPGLKASILFDTSCGRGIVTERWPAPPEGVCMGYAGGIGPDSVLEVLGSLGDGRPSTWIDMETRLRTNERFDLVKVETLLRKVDYVRKGLA